MNLLTIIYIVGAVAIGVIVGMIIELGIDSETIRTLREHNDKLQLENEALRQESPKEVIEILDRRSFEAGSLFDPF
jgi:uncharacterized membrane protein (DUF106 family)